MATYTTTATSVVIEELAGRKFLPVLMLAVGGFAALFLNGAVGPAPALLAAIVTLFWMTVLARRRTVITADRQGIHLVNGPRLPFGKTVDKRITYDQAGEIFFKTTKVVDKQRNDSWNRYEVFVAGMVFQVDKHQESSAKAVVDAMVAFRDGRA